MPETKVPGIAAKRVVITDECRTVRGDVGAFNKAAFQLLKEYDATTRLRVEEKGVNYHLVLTVEDTKRKPKKLPDCGSGRTLGAASVDEQSDEGTFPTGGEA